MASRRYSPKRALGGRRSDAFTAKTLAVPLQAMRLGDSKAEIAGRRHERWTSS